MTLTTFSAKEICLTYSLKKNIHRRLTKTRWAIAWYTVHRPATPVKFLKFTCWTKGCSIFDTVKKLLLMLSVPTVFLGLLGSGVNILLYRFYLSPFMTLTVNWPTLNEPLQKRLWNLSKLQYSGLPIRALQRLLHSRSSGNLPHTSWGLNHPWWPLSLQGHSVHPVN